MRAIRTIRSKLLVLAGLLLGGALLGGGCLGGGEAVNRGFLSRPVMAFDGRDRDRDLSCEIGGTFNTLDGGASGCLT